MRRVPLPKHPFRTISFCHCCCRGQTFKSSCAPPFHFRLQPKSLTSSFVKHIFSCARPLDFRLQPQSHFQLCQTYFLLRTTLPFPASTTISLPALLNILFPLHDPSTSGFNHNPSLPALSNKFFAVHDPSTSGSNHNLSLPALTTIFHCTTAHAPLNDRRFQHQHP